MKIRFPYYTASFTCECTLQEAIKRILKAAACRGNNLKIVKTCYAETQKIVLKPRADDILYHNSFLPITTIEIEEVNEASFISISFELLKSIKIMMTIFFAVAAFIGVAGALFLFWEEHQITTLVPLCYSFGMILFAYVLSSIGLKLSSKGIVKILFNALTQGTADRLPSIQKG